MRSGLPRLSFCDELGLDDQLVGAALEDGQLVGDVGLHGAVAVCYNPAGSRAGVAPARVGTNRS